MAKDEVAKTRTDSLQSEVFPKDDRMSARILAEIRQHLSSNSRGTAPLCGSADIRESSASLEEFVSVLQEYRNAAVALERHSDSLKNERSLDETRNASHEQ